MLTVLNRSQVLDVKWNIDLDLKGVLVVLECANEDKFGNRYCLQLVEHLAQQSQHPEQNSKRIFFLIFFYQKSNLQYNKLIKTYLNNRSLSKSHAALLVYNWSKKQLNFECVAYVRPLKNVCLVVNVYHEQSNVNVQDLIRNLLAIDLLNNRKFRCSFENITLNIAVNEVCICFN